jgi:hypothetical protein
VTDLHVIRYIMCTAHTIITVKYEHTLLHKQDHRIIVEVAQVPTPGTDPHPYAPGSVNAIQSGQSYHTTN